VGGCFGEVTDVEVGFVFNVIANFGSHINLKVFLDWVKSMMQRGKKRLIYYSQFLDTKTMRINSSEDLEKRS